MTCERQPSFHRSGQDDDRISAAAHRAELAVNTVEALRGKLHEQVKQLLPLYEEFQRAVEAKRDAVHNYIRLTGDERRFGGYFDYRDNLITYQDLKADRELFRIVKALRFCRACKVT